MSFADPLFSVRFKLHILLLMDLLHIVINQTFMRIFCYKIQILCPLYIVKSLQAIQLFYSSQVKLKTMIGLSSSNQSINHVYVSLQMDAIYLSPKLLLRYGPQSEYIAMLHTISQIPISVLISNNKSMSTNNIFDYKIISIICRPIKTNQACMSFVFEH